MLGATQTVTIWNRHRNKATGRDEWYRHMIPNCSWDAVIITQAAATSAVVASAYSVLIAEHPNYRDRRTWEALDAQSKGVFFTLAPGELMALGNVNREITGTAPYTEALVKNDLLPDAFTIKAVVDCSAAHMLGRHYEVTGV